ncbi:ATP-binding cassette domain-containing protein [Paenibacillus sp. TRM 82003]|uniref:ABC transporter ATP-binding protein n=1 Tax=Kineococcus sp. TRM81007 TaxID=2925831 RepID=UPI001F5732FB|nr:oligopeptide/dipeptide ABC transporter ATP-binding protein [Kineococcus sp. TRM81007]MCI2237049.1 ATP-binding cassette domain-containing protein [Kineococcus sp. TRM81007]MCI3926484.1 ATP-binding cassette domain-containing protein [Paenibacillus sp. TRM 82003]
MSPAGEPGPAGEKLLDVVDLAKTFPNGTRAADDVSFTVARGETLGVVGESGCGKSTTAKMVLRLLQPDRGTVTFAGTDVLRARGRDLKEVRRGLQLVPQNPQTSFNPRLTVRSSLEFNLRAHGVARRAWRSTVDDMLVRCGLRAEQGDSYPHELSGGQLQRAAIARALVTGPDLVVCDEAVSALDKSVQAQVLNLLAELQSDLGVSYLFISHDLSVVEHISDRVLVMYLGRVVEQATAGSLYRDPAHPYTKALLSSAPGAPGERIVLTGEPPNPADPPSGCTFRTRCPWVMDTCAAERPLLAVTPTGSLAACHLNLTSRPALAAPSPA